MNKTKFKFALALLATAATTLSGCFGKKDNTDGEEDLNGPVAFWSSFGGSYTNVLNGVCSDIQSATNIVVNHTSKGSYDEIKKALDANVALGPSYCPDIAQGYPDHFADYLSSDAIRPIESYFTEEELNDYYSEYMTENKFYDNNGKKAQEHIYGIPFNKSTELLGYNGVFVDYCATKNADLANIPATWEDWGTKGELYNNIFKDLFGKYVFGKQNTEGKASNFEVYTDEDKPETTKLANGDVVLASDHDMILLLDMSKVNSGNGYLMSWDATDNAFITLVRQWGAKYTEVDASENQKIAKKRIGKVYFNAPGEQEKVINCLKFFHGLRSKNMFATPQTLGGSYGSDAFALCRVMFMICSSGGLSYNTANWRHRFRVAPIPYKDASNKTVISQGANICMFEGKNNYKNSAAVIKALTSGEFQAQWCLETGYYPCSKKAVATDEYQAFLKETTYDSPTRVAYREGSKLNTEHYMNAAEGWKKFVDPAFKGSSVLRSVVKGVLDTTFSIAYPATNEQYANMLNAYENVPEVTGESTIQFVH